MACIARTTTRSPRPHQRPRAHQWTTVVGLAGTTILSGISRSRSHHYADSVITIASVGTGACPLCAGTPRWVSSRGREAEDARASLQVQPAELLGRQADAQGFAGGPYLLQAVRADQREDWEGLAQHVGQGGGVRRHPFTPSQLPCSLQALEVGLVVPGADHVRVGAVLGRVAPREEALRLRRPREQRELALAIPLLALDRGREAVLPGGLIPDGQAEVRTAGNEWDQSVLARVVDSCLQAPGRPV